MYHSTPGFRVIKKKKKIEANIRTRYATRKVISETRAGFLFCYSHTWRQLIQESVAPYPSPALLPQVMVTRGCPPPCLFLPTFFSLSLSLSLSRSKSRLHLTFLGTSGDSLHRQPLCFEDSDASLTPKRCVLGDADASLTANRCVLKIRILLHAWRQATPKSIAPYPPQS